MTSAVTSWASISMLRLSNAKKFRQGREYGSARWGTKKDIEPYMDEKFQNNILLTQTERLTMNGRPANPKYVQTFHQSVLHKTILAVEFLHPFDKLYEQVSDLEKRQEKGEEKLTLYFRSNSEISSTLSYSFP